MAGDETRRRVERREERWLWKRRGRRRRRSRSRSRITHLRKALCVGIVCVPHCDHVVGSARVWQLAWPCCFFGTPSPA